jgi:hypothetical protein
MSKIKAVGNMVLDVLAVPFGGPDDLDLDGEYFSPKTDLHLDKFTDPLILYWHGRDVGGSEQQKAEVIGESLGHTIKPDGLWIKVQLDKANKFAQRVWDAAKRGAAAASSGTVAHLMRKAADGFIRDWPLIEISLFDINQAARRLPVNKNAIALVSAKALYSQAGRDFPDLPTSKSVPDVFEKAVKKAVEKELKALAIKQFANEKLISMAFEREPTEAEQLYADAAVGVLRFFANSDIKSLPVRSSYYIPDDLFDGHSLGGIYDFDDKGNPRITLSPRDGKKNEYLYFLHELGHALDNHIRGKGEFYSEPYASKTAAREDQADEYRKFARFYSLESSVQFILWRRTSEIHQR